jgi:inorganic pyrophosphatase
MPNTRRPRTREAPPPTGLSAIPLWADGGDVHVIIETPKGCANKLKYEPTFSAFTLAKVLPAGMVFPFDFGFVPGTIGDDGDPLDVLLLIDAPVFPGCVVDARLIGVVEAEQRKQSELWQRNDRLLAVAAMSPTHDDMRDIGDVDDALLREIEAFFTQYQRVGGNDFRVLGRQGAAVATRLVRKQQV